MKNWGHTSRITNKDLVRYYIEIQCPKKILCQEECEFKDNVKTGKFTRIYHFDHKQQRIIENGIHWNNCESKSIFVLYDPKDKEIATMDFQKTKYIDKAHKNQHRTPESNVRLKCEYTIHWENRHEEGQYSYSMIDIQYYLIQPPCEIWRRGSFVFKNRCRTIMKILSIKFPFRMKFL